MVPTRLSIAKLGLDFVLFASVIVGCPFSDRRAVRAAAGTALTDAVASAAIALLALLVAAFVAWRFWFFHRNPTRKAPGGSTVLSPADGKLLYAERIDVAAPRDPHHARIRDAFSISGAWDVTATYLSIFDVHFVRDGDTVERGAVIRKTHMGSQVDL